MTVQEKTILNTIEAINTRRSIREYTADDVSQADLHMILELAGKAPSAWNLQPWRIVAVRNEALKEELKAAAYNQPQVGSAPVVLVIYSDMVDTLAHAENVIHPNIPVEEHTERANGIRQAFTQRSPEDTEQWGAGQTYIMVGYLSLAARALGFDTSLMLGFDATKVKQLLNLPDHVQVPAMITLGVGAEEGHSHYRHDVEAITTEIN